MWVQPSLAIAHLLQVAIDHGRYAVARKPEHRLERTALSKHDWWAARHLQRLAGVGGGRQEITECTDCSATKKASKIHVTLFVA